MGADGSGWAAETEAPDWNEAPEAAEQADASWEGSHAEPSGIVGNPAAQAAIEAAAIKAVKDYVQREPTTLNVNLGGELALRWTDPPVAEADEYARNPPAWHFWKWPIFGGK